MKPESTASGPCRGVVHRVGVDVTARALGGLVQHDLVLAVERPRGCEARDARTHDRNLHEALVRLS
jgi:hypothetical protein